MILKANDNSKEAAKAVGVEPLVRRDPISEYYERKRREQHAVYEKLQQARQAGASQREIAELEEQWLWVGYTGD